jgi:uncharacterized protein (DUF952 family)
MVHGAGMVLPSAVDRRDGFIHLSTRETMIETANLYFKVSESPVLLEVDAGLLGSKLRWEKVSSRENQHFPHLYAEGIPLTSIRAVIVLEHGAEGFTIGARERL